MSDDFFDSTICVYPIDERDIAKQDTAWSLIGPALDTASGVISFQFVQETLNVITGKFADRVTQSDALALMDEVLLPLWKVMPTPALYRRCLEIKARYRYHFYDSLIIAAALTAGCRHLYSEDLQHGHQIGGLTIVNPFA